MYFTYLNEFSSIIFHQDVGFSKEYEEIRADSCLDEYTAQDSQHPDNQDRNRYPNIVACKSIWIFYNKFQKWTWIEVYIQKRQMTFQYMVDIC